MSDEIRMGNPPPRSSESAPIRRLVPMRVGNATVFVEEVGEPVLIEAGDQVRPVAPPSPQEAFENAGEILHECVRVIGERIEALAAKARPQQITVEFSLSFEVKGQASLIPIFVTGESSAQTGLKVTAVWKRQEDKEHKHGSDSAQP
jgi:hypothetical protein